MKQLNPLNCPETFTILSLIAFVGLLITIISVTILLFRQLGTAAETMEIALDEIKDSVIEFINSKKGGGMMKKYLNIITVMGIIAEFISITQRY